jgi:hypothetical protein
LKTILLPNPFNSPRAGDGVMLCSPNFAQQNQNHQND